MGHNVIQIITIFHDNTCIFKYKYLVSKQVIKKSASEMTYLSYG